MGTGASTGNPDKAVVLDKHAVPPPDLIAEAVSLGRCIPCELAGPYALASYHSNTQGRAMGFESAAAYDTWFAAERARLAAFGSWEAWRAAANALEATSAEFAMGYGHHAMGANFDLSATRPRLEEERRKMIAAYEEPCSEAAAAEPGPFKRLTTEVGYASRPAQQGKKLHGSQLQPHSTIEDLYRGSVEALPALAALAREVGVAGAAAAGDAAVPVPFAWSLKKLGRVRKKLVEKYEGHVNKVSDVARASITFQTLRELLAGFDHVLSVAADATAGADDGGEGDDNSGKLRLVTVKNRFCHPCDGYADVLLNLSVGPSGTIVELQLHLARIYAVKGESGHGLFKWIRRIVLDEDSVYEGDEVTKGGIVWRHGQGSMRWASGARYEGGWHNGARHGHGRYVFPDGDVFDGEFLKDRFHGQGTYKSDDGSVFVGRFEEGKKALGAYLFVSGSAQCSAWDAKTGKLMVGEGVKWSRDRQDAWLCQDGEAQGAPVPLERAAEIAVRLGLAAELAPPPVHLELAEGEKAEEPAGPPDEREVTKGLALATQKFVRAADGSTVRLLYTARNDTADVLFELSADFKGSKGVELMPPPPPADGGTPKAGTPIAGKPKAGKPKAGTPKAGTPKAKGPKLKATVQVPPGATVQVAELKVNGADGFALKLKMGCSRQRAGGGGAAPEARKAGLLAAGKRAAAVGGEYGGF